MRSEVTNLYMALYACSSTAPFRAYNFCQFGEKRYTPPQRRPVWNFHRINMKMIWKPATYATRYNMSCMTSTSSMPYFVKMALAASDVSFSNCLNTNDSNEYEWNAR
ncbi:hypothetical protein PC128_g26789 [Phytophthora cactorum]|nr:hypothetical protein PC128_g26789 [Phytophthora cactorum]